MKRTPLRRKTPLRAKAKPRARLAHASDKQAERLARYKAMLAAWAGPTVCAKCLRKPGVEPHHPFGRGKENLFKVVLLCSCCHDGVHAFADIAFEAGWLQREYRGLPAGPHPTPWKAEHFITITP